MKSKLYILNSIEEFEDCKNEIRTCDQIIYTSELLGLQLKKMGCDFGYESFFKHLEVEDVNAIKYKCLDNCYKISQKIDSYLANNLKKEFGHSFSVYGPFVFYSSVIIATVQILNKFIVSKKEEFKEINIYDRKLVNFFDSGSNLSDLLRLNYLNYHELKIITNYKIKYLFKNYFRLNNIIRLYDLINWRLFIFKNNLLNYNLELHYFIRPLYDLKNYLKENKKNIKLIDFLNLLKKIKKSEVNLDFKVKSDVLEDEIYNKYFYNLSREINDKKNELFGRLGNLIKLLEGKKVHGFSWGNSPCQFTEKSILISALKEKYPIFGFQHGGSFVDQVYPYHYHSDFFRCTSYYSYGFRKKDLTSYQNELEDFRVLPSGKKLSLHNSKFSNEEILYVPTNSLDIYQGGILRTLPNGLLNTQLEILNTLNNQNTNNLQLNVKPFKNANIYNSSFIFEYNKFENLNYILNTTLIDYLKKSVPGLIVFDLPSTPLYEVLQTNSQVILFLDSVNPFTEEALTLLDKRVHICRSIDQIKSCIQNFVSSTLELKYNNEYYNRYVNPIS